MATNVYVRVAAPETNETPEMKAQRIEAAIVKFKREVKKEGTLTTLKKYEFFTPKPLARKQKSIAHKIAVNRTKAKNKNKKRAY